ncbi:MAG: hypothetical protein M1459_02550 [Patescibacteria group bacterium]|nr:hypothetical protein [Patescibacteria group bacterium]
MSRRQTIRAIKQELERVNREIDIRIIHGVPYNTLSRRHRFLLSQLRRLSAESWSWLYKSMNFVSTFVF